MTETNLTQSQEWQALLRHRDQLRQSSLADIILSDPQRLQTAELHFDGLKLNYALNGVTSQTIGLLCQLAAERHVESWRSLMWRGDKINNTENRAVLHVALRQSGDAPVKVEGRDIILDIRETHRRMADFSADVRNGTYRGITGKPIKHVVNIGIGGSDLGPRMAVRALTAYATGPEVHFVANADAFELQQLFKKLDPAETLFVVVSKTFTTQETLLNAETARAWVVQHLGDKAISRHFAAVSINLEAIKAFGISPEQTFPMWDWVGGRFSLWSAVGLSVCLALGMDHYNQLLRGAEAMDIHFKETPLATNMPVVLGMLGIWSRNFLGCAAHAVLPYSECLREFPRYLQQLEMESNGKSVGRNGQMVEVATTPVLFGEPGTVGQHGFHQWLHQGYETVSTDFIGVAEDASGLPQHHQALLSNMVAQAGALAFGQEQASKPQDIYAGNRGSNILMLERLDPYHLGMLLALYEHKVFVQSIIWGINPFDQPGVELGKRMARALGKSEALGGRGGTLLADLYRNIAK